jgi:hypothetical protein
MPDGLASSRLNPFSYKAVALVAGVFVMLLGTLVLVGWTFD